MLHYPFRPPLATLVPDPVLSSNDAELRAHVERVLSAQYELDREIGRGGMGIVYLARDRRLKRQVAIKLLPPELAFRSDIRSRFLKEAETAASLSHPNIVPIYSVDEREGLVYFVMAFVDGENLAVRLHRLGRCSPEETRRILLEVARALDYAHDRGVVHRDIKPDNILLCEDDGGWVMVTDFGIARAVSDPGDSRLTATGMAIGTPAYMSPEQAMGEREIDGRSDLYALGIVGYQMLAGEPPFIANSTPAMLVKHISERPEPLEQRVPGVPIDLARGIMMLLEKEPSNRFPTAEALVAALETGNMPDRPSTSLDLRQDGRSLAGDSRRSFASVPQSGVAVAGAPSRDEIARWSAPPVVAFRKKLAPFFAVSGVLIVLAAFGVMNMMGIAGLWSVFIAFQYAKLWTEGFDWRDVFKQPRDRLFFDVVAESIDDFRALFDKGKRAEVLERDRARARTRAIGGSDWGAESPAALPAAASVSGANGATVRRAAAHRDEIRRIVEALPKSERAQLGDVMGSASALYDRVESLALNLADIERSLPAGALDELEAEVRKLEAEANPLDRARSEERIRRLAQLKRRRRALTDLEQRRAQSTDKLESCALALHNMQLDLLRLRSGGQSFQHITLVAERAMALAQEVDNAVYVADEMARLRGGATSGERRVPRR